MEKTLFGRNFLGGFFFGRFFERIFWRIFFGGFYGGFFWGKGFFGRKVICKELIVCQEGRRKISILRSASASISNLKIEQVTMKANFINF